VKDINLLIIRDSSRRSEWPGFTPGNFAGASAGFSFVFPENWKP